MKTFKHMTEQPFVFATGLAALIHSTWSLGTLFSGIQPEANWASIHFWGWIAPAFLIAFALDVGQITTSAEIRANGLTWARGVTFGVFAMATYYLQWLYIAHHMPALVLSDGVQFGRDAALALRDFGLWLIPALLPLSTLLYTFSSGHTQAPAAAAPQAAAPVVAITHPTPPAPSLEVGDFQHLPPPTPIDDDEDTQPVNVPNPTKAPRRGRGAGKTQGASLSE